MDVKVRVLFIIMIIEYIGTWRDSLVLFSLGGGEGCTVYRAWGTPILGHGKEVPRWWPLFLRLLIWLGLYFIPHHDLIDRPLCAEKNGLSLSHLVPEILLPNVGLILP